MTDAVVIGSGPNGLVAANLLADRGWSVVVLEAENAPGGAVKSGELTEPGYVHDMFSAFYPLAAASRAVRDLHLEDHGLRWRHADDVVAHPRADGRCAVLSRDIERTAASLEAYAPGDGDAWHRLQSRWELIGDAMIEALHTPFPPVRPALRMARSLGPAGSASFLRTASLSVRKFAEESFRGAGGADLLAGNALHADLTPDSVGGGLFGWLLCSLGQSVGYPVAAGGAGNLTAALIRRLESRGGRVVCGNRVTEVVVRRGRASAVRTADGAEHPARRAVLADVGAPQLYLDLLAEEHVPRALLNELEMFQYDNSTIKVDWALTAPIPWTAVDARGAGTVHVAEGIDELAQTTGLLVRGMIPDNPFLVMGQYATADPARAPGDGDVAWAYTHVPQYTAGDAGGELTGSWDELELERFTERIEARVETLAPGFRDLVAGRHVYGPRELEAANANLVGGAINGGTAQAHQQVLFRPTPSHLGRPETPVRGLYLASASAHPGGGVHGGPGAIAARAATARNPAGRFAVAIGAGVPSSVVRRIRD